MSRHPTPDRLRHMLGITYLAELLSPTYAAVNHREAGDVFVEVKHGLELSGLHGPLCDAIWRALQHKQPGRDDATLLDGLAAALAGKIGLRRPAAKGAAAGRMGAMFVAFDVHVGRAGDTAQQALAGPKGQVMLKKAMAAAAEFLATHW
jgi:hypothetical protein